MKIDFNRKEQNKDFFISYNFIQFTYSHTISFTPKEFKFEILYKK